MKSDDIAFYRSECHALGAFFVDYPKK